MSVIKHPKETTTTLFNSSMSNQRTRLKAEELWKNWFTVDEVTKCKLISGNHKHRSLADSSIDIIDIFCLSDF